MTTTKAPFSTIDAPAILTSLRRRYPAAFNRWPEPAACTVIPVCLEVLGAEREATRADCMRLAHVIWDRARALPVASSGVALDEVLARVGLGIAPTLGISDVLAAWLAAGSLAKTLEKERDAENEVIRELGALRAGR